MAGIYIHIPFCKKKCSYCDFHFSTTFSSYRKELIDSLCKEIILRKEYLKKEEGLQNIETIYFGGGTPSLLSKKEIESILTTIRTIYSIDPKVEITLEANPDDLTFANLNLFKSIGINRLSIGLQSFRESDLQWMNRAHTSEESFNCIKYAQSVGFKNISIDLIYGLPNLSLEEWKKSIETAIALNVPHISAYCLTVEGKTALKKWVAEQKIIPSNEDEQSEQFNLLVEMLDNAGIKQYEISNFSKKGFESKHNSSYWKGIHYLGIGPSAHSFNGKSRSWNISNNRKYIQLIENKEDWFELEELTKENQFNELLLTGLRTIYGVNLKSLQEILPLQETFQSKVIQFSESNWMYTEKNILYLTKEGKLKADYIVSELFV